MNIGDQIQGLACKADGTVYRSWYTTVESMDTNLIVTVSPAGSMVIDKTKLGDHPIQYDLRSYYWLDKLYNLIEVFDAAGLPIQIYINIASSTEFGEGEIRFKDHELDVVRDMPGPARLTDEDEFADAVVKYQYSQELQERLQAAAEEALELANQWHAKPAPIF